jgi:biopolymer transport protein ExbD
VKGAGDSRREGTPDQIYIRTKLEAGDGQLVPGSGVDDWEKKVVPELEKKLAELAKTGKKANLKIAAAGGLEYQFVLSVYDAAKRAGFENLHFVPPAIKTKLKVDKK